VLFWCVEHTPIVCTDLSDTGIYFEGLRKISKRLSQDSGPRFEHGSPEYEAGVPVAKLQQHCHPLLGAFMLVPVCNTNRGSRGVTSGNNALHISEIWGSHGGEYEDGCLLVDECPDDGGSKHLWNVGKLLPDYTAQQPRRQPSSRYTEARTSTNTSVWRFSYTCLTFPPYHHKTASAPNTSLTRATLKIKALHSF
jgi:hypothetical protein